MKKAISIFIVLQLILSFTTFATAANGEYTAVDLPAGCLTSKGFLSESTAGTITDAEAVNPHFFVGSIGGTPHAVSKESMDALLTDGVFTWKGIPFNVKTLDNQKSMMGCTSTKVEIPTGYYSKVHVLVIDSPTNTGDNNIYRGMLGPDASGETSLPKSKEEFVTELEWAKVKASDNLTEKAKPKLKVQTLEISDKTKRFNRVSLWLQPTATKRIIAVTVEGLSGDEWKPVIENKIAKLPDSILSSEFNMQVYEEVAGFIEKATETGANIEAINGIEKYNNLKKEIAEKIVSVENYLENTDSDKIRMDINFTTPISEKSVKKDNFTVTLNGNSLEFDVEAIKEDDVIKGIRVITENKLNYNDEIEIVASKNIANGEDEKFTLVNDYEIVFKPTAPSIYIKEVKNENGKVTVTLKNNDKENAGSYALTLGVYDTDNQMKESKVFSGEIEKETEIELECEFEIGNADKIGCFLLDSFMTMNYLNCPIIK